MRLPFIHILEVEEENSIIVHILFSSSIYPNSRWRKEFLGLCTRVCKGCISGYREHFQDSFKNTFFCCDSFDDLTWDTMYPYRTSLYPVLFYASSLSEPQKSKSCWYQYKSSNNFVTYVNFWRWSKKVRPKFFNSDWKVPKEKPFGNINFCQVQRKYLLSMINVENLVSMIYWSLGMVFHIVYFLKYWIFWSSFALLSHVK